MVVVFRMKNVVNEIKELDVVVRKLERVILYIIGFGLDQCKKDHSIKTQEV